MFVTRRFLAVLPALALAPAAFGQTPSGGGAVAPETLGAKGDGVADDGPALNRAFAMGAPVRLTPGRTYRLTAPVSLPGGARFYGDRSAVLKVDADICAVLVTGVSDVVIRGIAIDGQKARWKNGNNHGIWIDWTKTAGRDVTVENCDVYDVASAGIIATASKDTPSTGFTVRGNRVRRTGGHGILSHDHISKVRVQDNRVEASGLIILDRPGITASRYGEDVVVTGNSCIGSPDARGVSVHGISLDNTKGAVCANNYVEGWTRGFGIEVGVVEGGTVSANTIRGCEYGIAGSGQEEYPGHNERVTIIGNSIDGCGMGVGFYVTAGTGKVVHKDIAVTGNVVTNTRLSPGIGIGYDMHWVDGLHLDGGQAIGSRLSGVYLTDCRNWFINGMHVRRNNLTDGKPTAPDQGGVRIAYVKLAEGQRGSNKMGVNDIQDNGGRDVIGA